VLHKRWSILALGILLLATMVLGGCIPAWVRSWRGEVSTPGQTPGSGEPEPDGQYGGMWLESLSRDPTSLDPAHAVALVEGRLVSLLYNGLVRCDENGSIVPDLAEEWQVDAQGLKYTFKLRQDVSFHNGQPFDAEDVEFTFRRLLSPATGSARSWVLLPLLGAAQYREGASNEIAGLRVEDRYTLTLVLQEPCAHFLSLLAMPAAYILDGDTTRSNETPALREAAGGVSGFKPIGTGPFMLADYLPGEEIRLTAKTDYHGIGPFLDGIVFYLGLDSDQEMRRFQEGQLTVIELDAAAADSLNCDARYQGCVLESTQPAVYYVGLNCSRDPLADVRLRRAINSAVDRETLLGALLPGEYTLAQGSIPPGVPAYDAGMQGRPYDPAKAKALIQEAGYTGGKALGFVHTEAPLADSLASGIAKQLAQVKLDIRDETVSSQEFYSRVGEQGDFDLFFLSWWGDYSDPENFLYPLFHSTNWGSSGNRVRYSNPEVDGLLDTAARMAADEKGRLDLYAQAHEIIFSEAPWIPLYHPVRHSAVQPFVSNYRLDSVYSAVKMNEVWFATGQ